jgi:polysaccharide export outer membrane protein
MGSEKFVKIALSVVLLALLSGCSLPMSNAERRTVPEQAALDPSTYTIGPGDQLQIFVRNNPDLSVTLPVRPDGKISVPMVQDIVAAGKTPSELATDLESELSEFIRQPTVTVMVRDFVGAYSDQVRIIGQAVRPQALAYREGMTVLDAIIQVGGLTQFAAGNRAKLVREVNGEKQTYDLRLEDLVNEGDISANVELRPGDILIIPEAYF